MGLSKFWNSTWTPQFKIPASDVSPLPFLRQDHDVDREHQIDASPFSSMMLSATRSGGHQASSPTLAPPLCADSGANAPAHCLHSIFLIRDFLRSNKLMVPFYHFCKLKAACNTLPNTLSTTVARQAMLNST